MTNREENKLTMYRGVLELMRKYADQAVALPVLTAVVAELDQAIQRIESLHQEHQTVSKGAARQKAADEEALIDQLMTLASLLYTYAARNGQEALKAVVKVTESDLRKMRDTELLARSRTILEQVETAQAALTDYGITDAAITGLRDHIAAYANALDSQEAAGGEKTAARQTLHRAFDGADLVLYEQLDPLMEAFRDRDQDFYNRYHSTRVIKDLR